MRNSLYRYFLLLVGMMMTLTTSADVETEDGHESATQAVLNMGPGWNLGNTLDSHGSWIGDHQSPDKYETMWGQPQADANLMRKLKEKGFGAVRVPVTWYQHMQADGSVDKDWMDRVQEVVDYVINAGMYCILNVHHDTGAHDVAWVVADASAYDAGKARYEKLWTEIATRFANYGDKLVFEAYNEMLDKSFSWTQPKSTSSYGVVTNWGESFVKAVRATGGNNQYRNLVISTYSAATSEQTLKNFKMPTDASQNHLIVEVHSYDPWNWVNTYNMTWTKECHQALVDMFGRLQNYIISKGWPVIVGEYGSNGEGEKTINASSTAAQKAEAGRQAADMSRLCRQYGAACFYWMGIIEGADRAERTFRWSMEQVADSIMKVYAPKTYTLSIQSSNGGSVSYDGTTISNTTKSFSVTSGSSATITITPNSDYKLSKLTVNSTDCTSQVSNNQYIISNIAANTTVVITFEANSTSGIEVNSTNFPDANFRNWILNNISGASDGWLTDAEIAKVTEILCWDNSINSLKGIEFFTALTYLDCKGNQLTSLDVSKNTALTQLHCYSNRLTSLDVSKNTALTRLRCYSNLLTSLDVSKNTALTQLECFFNQLTSLEVSKNTALTLLDCGGNQLTSLDVSKYPALTFLSCFSNQLTSLDLTKNTALRQLNCSSNQLTSLDVSKNTALTALDCYSNQLMALDLSNNTIISCSLYPQTVALTAVDISEGIAIPVPFEFNISKVSSLKIDETSVSGSVTTINGQKYLVFEQTGTSENTINGKNLTYNYDTSNSIGLMEVTVTLAYSTSTNTLTITVSGSGAVTYNGTNTVRNTSKTFIANTGANATLSFSPDDGYRIGSVKVNNTDVTANVVNNQYTISGIMTHTTVAVTFVENEYSSLTYDGVNYQVVSNSGKTVNVANGSYGYWLTVPASFTANGFEWSVTGIDKDVISGNPQLAAVIWNPAVQFSASVSNPNFLLYVTSSQYAPSSIKNVVVGNTANSITLTDASSGNNFYCPREFTAKQINYSHSYGMTTGINEARGWESIALPFDVEAITHSSKGTLVPFTNWQEGGSTKPFWLYQLGSTGFAEANSIKANTPYIISMPNNAEYKDEYRVAGTITFSSTDVTVKSSESLQNGSYSDRTFVPNFINQDTNSGFYVLNAINDYSTNAGGYAEGSHFVRNLRDVHPFEAYISIAGGSAREAFPIFDDETTWIPMHQNLSNEQSNQRIYNLNGQQIRIEGNTNNRSLKKGIYIVNGKKIVVR